MTDRTYYAGFSILVVIGAGLLPFTMGGVVPMWAGWIVVGAVIAWVLAWLIAREHADRDDADDDDADDDDE